MGDRDYRDIRPETLTPADGSYELGSCNECGDPIEHGEETIRLVYGFNAYGELIEPYDRDTDVIHTDCLADFADRVSATPALTPNQPSAESTDQPVSDAVEGDD